MKFIRNTHDENDNYRGSDYFGPQAELTKLCGVENFGGFCHMLSTKPQTLDEVFMWVKNYNTQHPDMPFCKEDVTFVAFVLIKLCETRHARCIV